MDIAQLHAEARATIARQRADVAEMAALVAEMKAGFPSDLAAFAAEMNGKPDEERAAGIETLLRLTVQHCGYAEAAYQTADKALNMARTWLDATHQATAAAVAARQPKRRGRE